MLDILALIAVAILVFLLFLLFFEPGPRYSVRGLATAVEEKSIMPRLGLILSSPLNSVDVRQVIFTGPDFYTTHANLIAAATSSIHLEAYIFEPDETGIRLLKNLSAKALAGVEVRLMLDRFGSYRVRKKHLQALMQAGGQVQFYHSPSWKKFRRLNNRSHRNLLICDGHTALVGGAGVADFWCNPQSYWRDAAVVVRGDAVLRLQSVFGENWLESAGEILAHGHLYPQLHATADEMAIVVGSSPVAGGSSSARVLFQLAVAAAQHSIDLCSPYFIPDQGMREELIAAQNRGVVVRILTSGPYSDHGLARRAGRRRYESLLLHGVDIYEFKNRMMHQKSLTIDGRYTVLGSTNIDNRSFNLNDEVNLVIESARLSRKLTEAFDDACQQSEKVSVDSWRRRSLSERLLAYLGRWLERHG